MPTAIVDLNGHAAYRFERFEIEGEAGTLRWDETGYRLWRIVAGKEPAELAIPERFSLPVREGDPALVAPFSRLIDRLHAAITGGGSMSPDFGDAVAVQCALDAARASGDAGSVVTIPRA